MCSTKQPSISISMVLLHVALISIVDFVLVPSQTWVMMLGYVHKDAKLNHFQVHLYNISDAEVQQGIAEWTSAKLSYEDEKILITKGNLFHRAYAYWLNNHAGVDMSFVEVMTRMLNSGKYMVVSSMLTQGQPLHKDSSEAMWSLARGNSLLSSEVETLLFAPRRTMMRPGAAVEGVHALSVRARALYMCLRCC